MTRIETALARMLPEPAWDEATDVERRLHRLDVADHDQRAANYETWWAERRATTASDMLATPTGQALTALVEAAERLSGLDWVDQAGSPERRFHAAVDAWLAATEPQPVGGES